MAKTVSKDICISAASEANAPEFTLTFLEALTQTFKAGGTTVYVNSSGYLADTASDTPSLIMGVPNQDASNNAANGSSAVNVSIANATNIFAANVLGTALADHVLVQSDIGRPMGIQRDTSNNRLFLNADTAAGGTNCRAFTLGLAQNTDVGDTNGRLLFIFIQNFSQSASTS